MRLNRTSVAVGLTVGLLAGGAGGVLAATGGSTATTPSGAGVGQIAGICGMSFGGSAVFTAATGYLGLSQADLQTRLRAGESFADVAKAQGKSVSGLEDAILAAVKSDLDANTALTTEQKAAILAQAKNNVDRMVNTTHSSGMGFGQGFGPAGHMGQGRSQVMGGGMMGGMWR